MLAKQEYGPITIFRTGRNIGKTVFYYVHCFLVDNILIDTSTTYVGQELLAALQNQPVSSIINTHHHEDHTGNNLLLQQALGVKIYAHPLAIPLMSKPQEGRQKFYLRFLWNYPQPSHGIPINDVFENDNYLFNIIHTPGHSPDHICVYDPKHKWLFSGDLFCGERGKNLRQDENFHEILTSLQQLANFDIDTIFCSVSGIIPNGNQALGRKITFMEDLKSKVQTLNRKGKSPVAIRRQLLGRENYMYWLSNGHFSKQNLVDSILELSH
mgnify:FL=1